MDEEIKLPDLVEVLTKLRGSEPLGKKLKGIEELIEPILHLNEKLSRDGLISFIGHAKHNYANSTSTEFVTVNEISFPLDLKSRDDGLLKWWERMTQFVSSLKGLNSLISLIVKSGNGMVRFVIGIGNEQKIYIKDNLNNFFPGSQIGAGEKIVHYENKIFVGGVPSITSDSIWQMPLTSIVEALYSTSTSSSDNYVLEFRISPIEERSIIELKNSLEKLFDRFNTLTSAELSIGSGTDNSESLSIPLVKQTAVVLMEMIKKEIERCKLAIQQGFWFANICFSSENIQMINKAASLFPSIFGGEDSFPMRLQVREKPFVSILTSSDVAAYYCFPNKEVPGFRIKEMFEFASNDEGTADEGTNDEGTNDEGTNDEGTNDEGTNDEGTNDEATNDEAIAGDLKIGKVLFNMRKTVNNFFLQSKDLLQHTFVTGVTGSGKTTTVKQLLRSLPDEIPFLVIEPVKTEYKVLKDIANFIEVGKDDFAMNLFKPAVNETEILTHIDYLRSVFNASFVMYPPMPYVLETALYFVYRKLGFGFDEMDIRCKNYPSLQHLIFVIERVVELTKYSSRLRDDISASLKLRLGNLLHGYKGRIFNAAANVPPFGELMSKRTIVNLNRIVDDEQKSLIISALLVNLYEFREAMGETEELKHVTVIEEAHRLLSNVGRENVSSDSNNPRARAVEFFANLLSEIRAYGEGLIIAEQIPSKLIPDVIKNTSTKICHKIVSKDDREIMGHSMNFDNGQDRILTILKKGEAVVFSNNTPKPILIKVNKPKKNC